MTIKRKVLVYRVAQMIELETEALDETGCLEHGLKMAQGELADLEPADCRFIAIMVKQPSLTGLVGLPSREQAKPKLS